MDSAEALQHFGTVTLGFDFMCQTITAVNPHTRTIDASRWIAAIPEAYRADVIRAVAPVCEAFLTEPRKATAAAVDSLIRQMHGAVLRDVRPAQAGEGV